MGFDQRSIFGRYVRSVFVVCAEVVESIVLRPQVVKWLEQSCMFLETLKTMRVLSVSPCEIGSWVFSVDESAHYIFSKLLVSFIVNNELLPKLVDVRGRTEWTLKVPDSILFVVRATVESAVCLSF